MRPRWLERSFYARATLTVARDLLGQRLVHVRDGQRVAGRIVEVEAYVGEQDQACHARSGRSERNATMYGPPGHAYVYFIYGMHHCFNAVTEREGFPAAVLVRALEPLEGLSIMRQRRGGRAQPELTNGPAKLCQALGISGDLDGADMCAPRSTLFIEHDLQVAEERVGCSPRIGVRGDEEAINAPWRLYIAGNRHVSRP